MINKEMLIKYADLLANYCLELKKGDRLFIDTTMLAEPLVKELYRLAVRIGAHVEVRLNFEDQQSIFMEEADQDQLKHISRFYRDVMENFEAYLFIKAPYTRKEKTSSVKEKILIRQEALKPVKETFFRRLGDGSLKRSLCQYPTQSSADLAGMTLEEYSRFIFNACYLYEDTPSDAWLKVRKQQQQIVDFLNTRSEIRYLNQNTDIQFSVKGRTWINSDGKTNMPSGEVFTGPVENSVNGVVHFNYPSVYMGQEVEDITLWVENGKVVKWEAKKGKDLLDKIFQISGAKYFGEVAIGTNYNIQRATKNILFDEKIGGTVHMAVGKSYVHTGGKNESSIHWDMISDMKHGGSIYADGEKIYEDGQFIIF